jgi:hypothetical protein
VPGRRASEQKDGCPGREEEREPRWSDYRSRRFAAGAPLGHRAVVGDRHLRVCGATEPVLDPLFKKWIKTGLKRHPGSEARTARR